MSPKTRRTTFPSTASQHQSSYAINLFSTNSGSIPKFPSPLKNFLKDLSMIVVRKAKSSRDTHEDADADDAETLQSSQTNPRQQKIIKSPPRQHNCCGRVPFFELPTFTTSCLARTYLVGATDSLNAIIAEINSKRKTAFGDFEFRSCHLAQQTRLLPFTHTSFKHISEYVLHGLYQLILIYSRYWRSIVCMQELH